MLGKLKDAAMRCILRPRKDASECVCSWGSAPDPAGGAYSASLDSLAGFGERNREGEMEKAREGMRTVWEGKGDGEGKGEGAGEGMEIGGSLRHWL